MLEEIYRKGGVFKNPKVFQCDIKFKNEVKKLLETHSDDIRRATPKYNHTDTPFLKVFNKELLKLSFKPVDLQELQDHEKVSTIWVKKLGPTVKKVKRQNH